GPVAVRDRLRRPHRSARHGTGPGPGVQTGGRIRPFPARTHHASHAATRGEPMRLIMPTSPRSYPPGQLPPPPDPSEASQESGTVTAGRSGPALRQHLLMAVVVAGLSTAVLLATAAVAHADQGAGVVALVDSVTTVLNNVRNWIMGILAGLATVFLTIGGV